MVRRDGAAIRKERMQEIARIVQSLLQKHKTISLSKTIMMFQYQFGLTKDKIMEYIKIPEGLGQFIIEVEKDTIERIDES